MDEWMKSSAAVEALGPNDVMLVIGTTGESVCVDLCILSAAAEAKDRMLAIGAVGVRPPLCIFSEQKKRSCPL